LLFAAYFLEAGLLLIVIPWSGFWDRNIFASFIPGIGRLLANPFVRGAVSGVGVITTLAGVAELIAALVIRKRDAEGAKGAGA
jgi:hypothetical protein